MNKIDDFNYCPIGSLKLTYLFLLKDTPAPVLLVPTLLTAFLSVSPFRCGNLDKWAQVAKVFMRLAEYVLYVLHTYSLLQQAPLSSSFSAETLALVNVWNGVNHTLTPDTSSAYSLSTILKSVPTLLSTVQDPITKVLWH